jgi:hypothetical protein
MLDAHRGALGRYVAGAPPGVAVRSAPARRQPLAVADRQLPDLFDAVACADAAEPSAWPAAGPSPVCGPLAHCTALRLADSGTHAVDTRDPWVSMMVKAVLPAPMSVFAATVERLDDP